MHPNELRGSGRTTRMIDEAIREARHGKTVFLIAANTMHEIFLFRKAVERRGDGDWEIRQSQSEMIFLSGGRAIGKVVSRVDSKIRFDWDLMRCTMFGPDSVYLVDHFTIESRFGDVLTMLHRWDPTTTITPSLPEMISGDFNPILPS